MDVLNFLVGDFLKCRCNLVFVVSIVVNLGIRNEGLK